MCGSISFFFASFVFAFFYLKALDTNHSWKIGRVVPDGGFGIAIAALFLFSAVIYRLAARRPAGDSMAAGTIAVVMGLVAVVLQFVEYSVLDFGASQGGYAAVFFGWTATYAIVALMGLYWIEIQVASLWRVRRAGEMRETEVPTSESALLLAGIEASSFYWAFFVVIRRSRVRPPVPRRLTMPLTPWSLDPSLIYVALAAGLYVLGSRGRDRPQPLQALAFFASLLVIVIALCSPIDYYADRAVLGTHAAAHPAAHHRPVADAAWAPMAANVACVSARPAHKGCADDRACALGGTGACAGATHPGVDPVQRHDRRLAYPRCV